MKYSILFATIITIALRSWVVAQETYNYNFTNASVHLSHTVNVTTTDFISMTNQGVPSQHEVRFGLDTYFLEDDVMSVHNTTVNFDTGQAFTKAMSEIDASLFYIRVTDPIGITRLTLTVNRGFSDIQEEEPSVVSLFPNPCTDLIFVAGFVGTISIFDSSGGLIYHANPQGENVQIRVADFPQGIYFVSIDKKKWMKLVK